LGALLALAACGSSASKATGGTSTSGSTGVQARILVVGTFTAASALVPFTTPEVIPAVKGVFRNLPGVQIETCDTKGDPSAGLTCERKAISDQVAAVIDGSGLLSANQALLTRRAFRW
jgi:hypothetical protein